MKENESKALDTDDLKKDLKFSKGDAAVAVTKATVSLIPILGGPAADLFDAVTAPMLSKRRDAWMVMFAEAINELHANKFDIDKLIHDEKFITIVTYASQVAIRNHQKEKLEALKNVVLNSVIYNHILIDDLELILLNLVDSFTPSHIKVLTLIKENKPEELQKKILKTLNNVRSINGNYDFNQVLIEIYPELKNTLTFVIDDLKSKNFILGVWKDGYVITRSGYLRISLSEYGERFLDFITAPNYEKLNADTD